MGRKVVFTCDRCGAKMDEQSGVFITTVDDEGKIFHITNRLVLTKYAGSSCEQMGGA